MQQIVFAEADFPVISQEPAAPAKAQESPQHQCAAVVSGALLVPTALVMNVPEASWHDPPPLAHA